MLGGLPNPCHPVCEAEVPSPREGHTNEGATRLLLPLVRRGGYKKKSMTQPDYDRIAEALNQAMHRTPTVAGRVDVGEAMKLLGYEFDSTDVRFNFTRFIEICLK